MNDRMTLREYLDDWIEHKTDIKRKTKSLYSGHINRYWSKHIGHIRMADLRVSHLNLVFDAIRERNDLVATGRLRGVRHVGPASMQRIRATLRVALSDAMKGEEGLVSVNVATLVKLPSGKSPKPIVWTAEREQRWRKEITHKVATGMKYAKARSTTPLPSAAMVWRPDHLGTFLDHNEGHQLYAL
ncbi:hypothetical protein ABTX61_21435 [Amycolatopsis japonica]|uniref:hypothetical protein n=1 Tax=Amycolatopsis japonica TaxID=208439 RepID=UPI00332ED453